MKREVKLNIVNSINFDINVGVYDSYPGLKSRLNFIASKLLESAYVINSSKELSAGEIRTLQENNYVSKNYLNK